MEWISILFIYFSFSGGVDFFKNWIERKKNKYYSFYSTRSPPRARARIHQNHFHHYCLHLASEKKERFLNILFSSVSNTLELASIHIHLMDPLPNSFIFLFSLGFLHLGMLKDSMEYPQSTQHLCTLFHTESALYYVFFRRKKSLLSLMMLIQRCEPSELNTLKIFHTLFIAVSWVPPWHTTRWTWARRMWLELNYISQMRHSSIFFYCWRQCKWTNKEYSFLSGYAFKLIILK